MAAFKRRGSPYYQIAPQIDGRRVRQMTTGVRDRQLAEDMEAAIRTIYRMGFRELVDQLDAGHVTLSEVWQAFLDGREALERLQSRQRDPLLVDVIANARRRVKDARALTGLDQLEEYVQEHAKGARFGWLAEFSNINGFYEAMAETMAPNSVRRGPHRAVSELLRRQLGRGRMLAILADVEIPGGRDERRVMLWPDEIQRFYHLADAEMRDVFGLAITTGIDRAPMLSIHVRDWSDATRELVVPDEKADGRHRTLVLEEGMAVFVRRLAAGKEPHEPLVDLRPDQLRYRWQALRQAAKRPDVRWKDLRGVFATYAVRCAWPARKLQDWMGHTNPAMTIRYQRRLPVGMDPEPGPIAERMGLGRTHLNIVAGGQS